MRISTSTIFDLGLAGIQQQTSDMVKTQQQISTGRRILTPADDPVASARVLEVSQAKALNLQYDVNTNSATSALALEDTVLESVTNLLLDVNTTAHTAQAQSMDKTTLSGLAIGLRGRYQELLGLANSTDGNGQYMFSGFRGATQPFSQTVPGDVKYIGDQGQRLIQIAPSRQIAVSDAGSDAFTLIKNGNGVFVTAAAAGNTGTGLVSPGTVLDPAKWAAVTDKNLTVQFSVNSSVTPPVTTYDILDSTNTSILPAPRTYTSGSSISLSGLASPPASSTDYGVELSVSGAPANGDSFTVKASTNESLFTTIDNFIRDLETAALNPTNTTARLNNVTTALSNLKNGLDQVLKVRASVGMRMQEIEAVKISGEDIGLQYEQTLSGLQDLDYAKAVTDLTRQQTQLQAAQQSFAKIQGLSLFNYIS